MMKPFAPRDDFLSMLPKSILYAVEGFPLYDSSSSPDARVYFVDREDGMFLKVSAAGSLNAEAQMQDYFHKLGLAPQRLQYYSGERDFLLSSKGRGTSCIDPSYLSEPERLCDLLSENLRQLHERDWSGCPVKSVLPSYFASADSFFQKAIEEKNGASEGGCCDPLRAFRFFQERSALLQNEVLIHGDFCLPNILLDEWSFSCYIDLGAAGVGDRHMDLYWALWSLWYNLKSDRLTNRFLDGYGRDLVDSERLRVIAAAESLI